MCLYVGKHIKEAVENIVNPPPAPPPTVTVASDIVMANADGTLLHAVNGKLAESRIQNHLFALYTLRCRFPNDAYRQQ